MAGWIDWHVRENKDSTEYKSLRVYFFQKTPNEHNIIEWRNALVDKINQYNQSQLANFSLPNQPQSYTFTQQVNDANYALFNSLHTKYPGDFCGDDMNPMYINISIGKDNICMYVTDSSTGEERLHSVVIFDFKTNTVLHNSIIKLTPIIYIDIFCTSTLRGYVNFRGGYRLMSLLYGICRLLRREIHLHSLDAAIEFYKKSGYKETPDPKSSLPKFVSTCAPRNKKTIKDVVEYVVAAKRLISGIRGFAGTPEQEEAFAKAQAIKEEKDIKNSLFSRINDLDREDSGLTEAQSEVVVEAEVVYHNNDYWKVSNKVVDDNGTVISYNLYSENHEGNMTIRMCVPAEYVEPMDEHSKRLLNEKATQKQSWLAEEQERRIAQEEQQRVAREEEVSESFKNRPTGSHLFDFPTKRLIDKLKKKSKGGSRKQPRKTKKRKTKRNSKKNKKNI